MKRLAIIAAMLLSGCTALNVLEQKAVSNIKDADDHIIAVWSTAACATPFSAVMRNPQIVPAMRALCVPQNAVTPADLLDAAAKK